MLRTLTGFHVRITWRTAQAKPGYLYAGITKGAVSDNAVLVKLKLGAAEHQIVLWQCALPSACLELGISHGQLTSVSGKTGGQGAAEDGHFTWPAHIVMDEGPDAL